MTRSAAPALPLGRVTIGLAVVALVIAGVLAGRAVDNTRSGEIRVATVAPRTPLSETLDRCRLSAAGGADDPGCRAAWSESRDRFFANPRPEPSDE